MVLSVVSGGGYTLFWGVDIGSRFVLGKLNVVEIGFLMFRLHKQATTGTGTEKATTTATTTTTTAAPTTAATAATKKCRKVIFLVAFLGIFSLWDYPQKNVGRVDSLPSVG